jgi:hypothetical protein
LSAATRATAALRVVRRIRRRVPHVDDTQAADVYPQFHCRRTEQRTDGAAPDFAFVVAAILRLPFRAKAVFAILFVFVVELSGVIGGKQQLSHSVVAAINTLKKLIWTEREGLVGAQFHRISTHSLTVAGSPDNFREFQLVKTCLFAFSILGFGAGQVTGFVFESGQQLFDEVLVIRSFQIVVQFVLGKPAHVSSVSTLRPDAPRFATTVTRERFGANRSRRRYVILVLISPRAPEAVLGTPSRVP